MNIPIAANTAALLGRIADTRQAVQPNYPDTSEKPPYRITPIRQPFSRVAPEEEGVPSAAVADFLEAVSADETLNMHCILILCRGKMIAEAVFGDQDPRIWKMTFSACKSVTSLAVGFLYDEGKIEAFYSDSHSDDPMAALAERAFLVKGERLLPWGRGK